MIRKHFRFKRLILGLAVGFAIAAVTAPVVSAMRVDSATGGAQASSEKYGTLDPWAYNVIHRSTQTNVVPAGKYGQLDPWAYTVIHQSSPSVVTARPANGFDYSDAGIGASIVVRRRDLAADGCRTRSAIPIEVRSLRPRHLVAGAGIKRERASGARSGLVP